MTTALSRKPTLTEVTLPEAADVGFYLFGLIFFPAGSRRKTRPRQLKDHHC